MGLSAEDGWLGINGEKAKQFGLWTATAPERVEVELRPLRGRRKMQVRVWNIWKAESWGSTMAWTGNAGIVIESANARSATLHASAGPGPLRFDDLVIDLKFVPAAT